MSSLNDNVMSSCHLKSIISFVILWQGAHSSYIQKQFKKCATLFDLEMIMIVANYNYMQDEPEGFYLSFRSQA